MSFTKSNIFLWISIALLLTFTYLAFFHQSLMNFTPLHPIILSLILNTLIIIYHLIALFYYRRPTVIIFLAIDLIICLLIISVLFLANVFQFT